MSASRSTDKRLPREPAGATAAPGGLRAMLRALPSLAKNARATVALVASVSRALLGVLLACQLAEALFAVAVAWVGKRLVDAVVLAAQSPGGPAALREAAVRWVLVELALVAARAAVAQAQQYAALRLRGGLGLRVNTLLLEKAGDVSYARFEEPEFNNLLLQARREASARPLDVVNQLLAVVRGAITLLGYGALLWSLGPWSVGLIVLSSAPAFFGEAAFGRRAYELQRARSQRNRRLNYLEQVLTQEQSVKEVKLFALGPWLRGWYAELYEGFNAEEAQLARTRGATQLALGLLATGALYGTYAVLAARAAAGALTLGAMTLYVTVFRGAQSTLQAVLGAFAKLYEDNLYMSNLYEFLAQPSDEPGAPLGADEPSESAPVRVVFERVSFAYPGSDKPVLDDVSLTLEPGETVALVGSNGAGKTTLVKLLVGLYRPTSGRLLVDGVDAATLSPSELRRRVGVIFQDFARYQFSAGDNIGVGWLPKREDRAALERAVRDAGADDVLARLPQGLDTPLGRAFGGDDLSVGQWQRVALARAFMRGGGLLVLDEPTAALDPEAEQAVFERFRELKRGRTALLITHRFGSVRMADRVVVLDRGRVLEQGTHAALLAAGGRYAELFRTQAAGYADATERAPVL